jgi:hypothetical protein
MQMLTLAHQVQQQASARALPTPSVVPNYLASGRRGEE